MTTTLLDRLTAAIDEAERDARRCEEVFPCDWELSDRGWMAHVTANGPHFPTVVTLDQNQVAEDFGYLADALRHFVRQNPKATLIRCAADRKTVQRHAPVQGPIRTLCATCHHVTPNGYAMRVEWPCPTLLDRAAAYDLTVKED